MTKFAKKLTTAIATGAVLLNAFTPLALADTVIVSGNGDSSNNDVSTTNTNTNTVTQANTSNISNTVNSVADSGGNSASRNTGGDSVIDTGNAASNVTVSNAANLNQATLPNCNCNTNTGVLVSGNGVDTRNKVDVTNSNTNALTQANNVQLTNDVTSNAKTGNNDVNRNTGGTSAVFTGDATSNVDVNNAANVNVANLGGNNGAGSDVAGSTNPTVIITGNGDSSRNNVDLTNRNSATLTQANVSAILNDVSAKATTGYNDTNRNTGGDSLIDTGNAKTNVTVNNEPNFNVASLADCGCSADSLLKVVGNGVDSHSSIYDTNANTLAVVNSNVDNLINDLTPEAKSGHNDASRDTGAVYGIDPVTVTTGNSTSNTTVDNAGNVNTVGPQLDVTLPVMGDVHFTSNFSSLWEAWMAFMSNH